MAPPLSRRQLIHLVGKAGGTAAAYQIMSTLGLLPMGTAYAGPPKLPPGSGAGIDVLILGASIAGMVAALELRQAGYNCTILEARSRAGGRNWSLRSGDIVEELGSKPQLARWDREPHMYFNPGPARIPHHHRGILDYCRKLEVPVEVMVNDSRGAYLQDDAAFAGEPQLARRVVNDARGFVAELAAKAVNQKLLDDPLSPEDRRRLLDFLRQFGALDKIFKYRGSERSGYCIPPGAGEQTGELNAPIDFWQLLASDFWRDPVVKMNYAEHYPQQATMLQPVGGMDKIGQAFARRVGWSSSTTRRSPKFAKLTAGFVLFGKTGNAIMPLRSVKHPTSSALFRYRCFVTLIPTSVLRFGRL